MYKAGTYRLVLAPLGIAAAACASYSAITWLRYGSPRRTLAGEPAHDALLEQFMPNYDVVDRRSAAVAAPASRVYDVFCNLKLEQFAVVRLLFNLRALVLRAGRQDTPAERAGLRELAAQWGWGLLADVPGREAVFGACTQPWKGAPQFRALPPEQFGGWNEPGYVKIAWSFRADPEGGGSSIARSETRAVATSPDARARFRRYWAFVAPGVSLIRWIGLPAVKRGAEQR